MRPMELAARPLVTQCCDDDDSYLRAQPSSGSFKQSELLQRSHTVVETDLFDDLAVL